MQRGKNYCKNPRISELKICFFFLFKMTTPNLINTLNILEENSRGSNIVSL